MPPKFPALTDSFRTARLEPPRQDAPLPCVLDTDTYNEVDDQFALAWAALSPERVDLQAVYAAPFHNERSDSPGDGMERSHAEILRLFELLAPRARGEVFRGSDRYLPSADEAVESEAARDLVERARAMPDGEPLYVIAIGAPTNVAAALLMAPDIVEKVVLVWLGGNAFHWHTAWEFNLQQDLHAVRLLLDCGAPLVLVPCMGVASNLHTSVPELRAHFAGQGPLAEFLLETVAGYHEDHFGWSKIIWDLAAVAWVALPTCMQSRLVQSPLLSDEKRWGHDGRRHLIRIADWVHRDPIFRDVFQKIRAHG